MHWITHWYSHLQVKLDVLLPGLALLIGGALVIFVATRLLERALQRSRLPLSMDTTMLIRRGTASALWIVLILLVLRHWGVNVSGIWTMLASVLAVIGVGMLAVWTMVSNITAAFFIWIWRPYHLGENLEILPDGLKGRAVDRSLMFTEIEEEDGSTLMVPNNLIFQRVIRRSPGARKPPVPAESRDGDREPRDQDGNAGALQADKL